MRSTPSEPLLLHNTMRITDGHLDGFKEAVRRAVEFVEEHGPQLMVQVFIDEADMIAHSFQLYADSDAIRAHWTLSDPYIKAVMEHCTVERLEMYGEPDQIVRDALRPIATDDAVRVMVPRHIGFLRRPGAGDEPAPPWQSDRSMSVQWVRVSGK